MMKLDIRKVFENVIGVCFFLVVCMPHTNAQATNPLFVWATKADGGVESKAYKVDNEGNSYVTGYFYGQVSIGEDTLKTSSTSDIFISKTNPLGNFVWTIHIGGSGEDVGSAITVGDDGSIYVSGWFSDTVSFGDVKLTSLGDSDLFVTKLDNEGNFLWTIQAGGNLADQANGIAMSSDGSLFIVGTLASEMALFNSIVTLGKRGMIIANLSSEGAFNWVVRTEGGIAKDIAVDAKYNIFIVADFSNTFKCEHIELHSEYSNDILIAKLNKSGKISWAKSTVGLGSTYVTAIALDRYSNLHIIGKFSESITFDTIALNSSGSDDIFIAKLDVDGNYLWVQKAGGQEADQGNDLVVGVDDNIYITGGFRGISNFGNKKILSLGNVDIFVACLNANGEFVWAIQTGGSRVEDLGNCISSDNKGAIYINGSFRNNVVFGDISLLHRGMYNAKILLCPFLNIHETVTDARCSNSNDGAIAIDSLVGGTPPYSYVWSNGSHEQNIYGLNFGFYAVTITDSKGCYTKAAYTINSPSPILITNVRHMPPSCEGFDNGMLEVYANGGVTPYTFTWSNGMEGAIISGLSDGIYTVTVTDSNGCTSEILGSVGSPPIFYLYVNSVTDASGSHQVDGSIDVTIIGGKPPFTFSWYYNGELVANTEDIIGVPAGIYVLIVEDANGCQLVSDSIEVKQLTVANQVLSDSLLLYPNPAIDRVYLRLSAMNTTPKKVTLTDMSGVSLTLPVKADNQGFSFGIYQLASGTYIVRFLIDGHMVFKTLVIGD